jgi:hypothetical protein
MGWKFLVFFLILVGNYVSLGLNNNNDRNLFTILGFSVKDDDSQHKLWWRWLIPSYYQEYIRDLNLTTSSLYHDTSICQLRFYMASERNQNLNYQRGGEGLIDQLNISQGQVNLKNIKCYYMSSLGPWFDDKKHEFLRYVIYCPLLPDHLKLPASSHDKLHHNIPLNFCESIKEDSSIKLTIKSSHINLLDNHESQEVSLFYQSNKQHNYDSHIYTIDQHQTVYSYATKPFTTSSKKTNNSRLIDYRHTHSIVCTIQTFKSPLTGPFLYLFTIYHSTLGIDYDCDGTN